MNNNLYFIIDNNQELFDSIYNNVVEESIDNTRRSVDGTKIVVKLPKGDTQIPEALVGETAYSHSEILSVLSTPEWTNELI